MKLIIKSFLAVICVLLLLYALGPSARKFQPDPALPTVSADLYQLEDSIASAEAKVPGLKPGNASSIVWAMDSAVRTPYSIVYLHGFSSSPMEGDPIHRRLAERYGANLYLPRLFGHGIASEDAFLDLTGEALVSSAKEALAIGMALGDTVILMSCSTGGTLSLYLAAHHPEVKSLILYAPNVDLADPKSAMIIMPWGLQLSRMAFGGKYRSWEASPAVNNYWTTRYRLEGLIQVKALVKGTMTRETFERIRQPLFMGYYYRSVEEQDDIVSVPAMRTMFSQVSTPEGQKWDVPFPDAGTHVINSSLMSEDIEGVWQKTVEFCEQVLHMRPVQPE